MFTSSNSHGAGHPQPAHSGSNCTTGKVLADSLLLSRAVDLARVSTNADTSHVLFRQYLRDCSHLAMVGPFQPKVLLS